MTKRQQQKIAFICGGLFPRGASNARHPGVLYSDHLPYDSSEFLGNKILFPKALSILNFKVRDPKSTCVRLVPNKYGGTPEITR